MKYRQKLSGLLLVAMMSVAPISTSFAKDKPMNMSSQTSVQKYSITAHFKQIGAQKYKVTIQTNIPGQLAVNVHLQAFKRKDVINIGIDERVRVKDGHGSVVLNAHNHPQLRALIGPNQVELPGGQYEILVSLFPVHDLLDAKAKSSALRDVLIHKIPPFTIQGSFDFQRFLARYQSRKKP